MEQLDDNLLFRALPLPYCAEKINQTFPRNNVRDSLKLGYRC